MGGSLFPFPSLCLEVSTFLGSGDWKEAILGDVTLPPGGQKIGHLEANDPGEGPSLVAE